MSCWLPRPFPQSSPTMPHGVSFTRPRGQGSPRWPDTSPDVGVDLEASRLPCTLWVGLVQSVEGLKRQEWDALPPRKKGHGLKVAAENVCLRHKNASTVP